MPVTPIHNSPILPADQAIENASKRQKLFDNSAAESKSNHELSHERKKNFESNQMIVQVSQLSLSEEREASLNSSREALSLSAVSSAPMDSMNLEQRFLEAIILEDIDEVNRLLEDANLTTQTLITTFTTRENPNEPYTPLELAIKLEKFDILEVLLHAHQCTKEVFVHLTPRGYKFFHTLLFSAIVFKKVKACELILKAPQFKSEYLLIASNTDNPLPNNYYFRKVFHTKSYDIFELFLKELDPEVMLTGLMNTSFENDDTFLAYIFEYYYPVHHELPEGKEFIFEAI